MQNGLAYHFVIGNGTSTGNGIQSEGRNNDAFAFTTSDSSR
jgi:hypothetical protein